MTGEKRKPKMICLCAAACIGKTTYMNGIAGLNDKYPSEYIPEERPLTLSLGGFFRETLGAEFFKDMKNPGSPQATENWVKTMVHHALEMGRNFNRDLISDAFPRNVQQLKWLLHSSYASNHTIGIEIRFLYVDELVHGVRLKQRLDACKTKDECEFLRQRHETDRHGVVSVFEEASKMIKSKAYVNLSMRKVDV
ncbi:hypothetical protein KAR91_62590 [Candidatus Pacearchaeota archaeon]|nr:hypothetical protein [Candidatus Pacearchaeota archaeon]